MAKVKAPLQREHAAKDDLKEKKNTLDDAVSVAPPVFTLAASPPAEEEEDSGLNDGFAPEALVNAAAADGDSGGEDDGQNDANSGGDSAQTSRGGDPDEDDEDPESLKHKTYTMPAVEASNLMLQGAFRYPQDTAHRGGYHIVRNPKEGIRLNRKANQKIHLVPKVTGKPLDKQHFNFGAAIQMKPADGGDGPPKATPFVAQMHGPGNGPGGGPPNPGGGGPEPGPEPQGPSPTPAEQEGSGLPPTDGGSKLPASLSEKFEAAFASDFGSVRLHIDSDYAEQIGAQAFTYGEHIYFAPGKFNPSSMTGIRLIAHEIVHVLQQREGAVQPNMRLGRLNINYDRRLEREADEFGGLAAEFDMSWLEHWNDVVEDLVEMMVEYQENDGTWEGWENQAGAGAYEEYLDGHGEEERVSPDYHTPEPEYIPEPSNSETEIPGGEKSAGGGESGEGGGPDLTIRDNPALDNVGQYLQEQAAPVIAQDKAEIQELGTNEREKEDTTTKVVKAKSYSAQPTVEPGSRVERDKAGEVDEVQEPVTRPEEAKGEFDTKLQTILPKTLKDVYKFKKRKKAQVLPAAAMKVVKADVDTIDGTYREIENLPFAVNADPGEALEGIEKAPKTQPIKGGQGAIAPLQAEHMDFQVYSDQVDEAIAREHVDDEKLELIKTGKVNDAREKRDEVRKGAEDAPESIEQARDDEQKGLNRKMKDKEKKSRSGMENDRNTGLKAAQQKQERAKTQIEKDRERVSTHINSLYENARNTVTEKLEHLSTSSLQEFQQAQEVATREFEDNVDKRIRAFKKKRYKGWRGKLRWLKDLFKGIAHLDEVKEILDSEKAAFVEKIDTAITGIMERSKETIDECKLIVSNTRAEIDEYIETLKGSLQWYANTLRDEVFGKLDLLDYKITVKEDELRNELEAAKQEAIEAIEKIIADLKKKMRGLLEIFISLIFKIAILVIKGLLLLFGLDPEPFLDLIRGVEAAIIAIIKQPMEFFQNAFSALKEGFKMFTSDLKKNLLQPIIQWLMGKFAGTGLYIPKSFSGKEILKLALSVFGLSWDAIKQKLVNKMGAWGTVAMNLYDIWKAFKKDGIKGVWDAYSGYVTNWSYNKLRKKMVKKMGEEKVRVMESTIRLVVRVMEEGPEALLEELEAGLDILKQMAIDYIREWLIEKLIKKGLEKIMANFVPGVNFIAWIYTIYTLVIWFFSNIDLFGTLFSAIGKSLQNIADGDIMAAAEKFVVAMRAAIVLALDFLALYLGFNRVVDKVQEVLDKIRGPIGKAIDAAIDWILRIFKRVFDALKRFFTGGNDDGTDGAGEIDPDDDGSGGDGGDGGVSEDDQEILDNYDGRFGDLLKYGPEFRADIIRSLYDLEERNELVKNPDGTISMENAEFVAGDNGTIYGPFFDSITVVQDKDVPVGEEVSPNREEGSLVYNWFLGLGSFLMAGIEEILTTNWIEAYQGYLVGLGKGVWSSIVAIGDLAVLIKDAFMLWWDGILNELLWAIGRALVEKSIEEGGIGWIADMIGEVLGAIPGAISTYLNDLVEWWKNEATDFEKGEFVGTVVGAIVFEVLIAWATAGMGNAITNAGRAGKLGRWSQKFIFALDAVDDAILRGTGEAAVKLRRLLRLVKRRSKMAHLQDENVRNWLLDIETDELFDELVYKVLDDDAARAALQLIPDKDQLERLIKLPQIIEIGDISRLMQNPKVVDADQLEALLELTAEVTQLNDMLELATDAAQILRILADGGDLADLARVMEKVDMDLVELERLIAKLDDFAQLERILDFDVIQDTAKLEELLDAVNGGSALEGILRRIKALWGDGYLEGLSQDMRARYLKFLDDFLDGKVGSIHAALAVMEQSKLLRVALANVRASANIAGRNIGWGDFVIDLGDAGNLGGNFLSVSGKSTSQSIRQDVGGVVRGLNVIDDIRGGTRRFTPSRGHHDSEIKLMEYLASQIQELTDVPIVKNGKYPQFSGTIELNSEMTLCSSCQMVVEDQWKDMFPNITILPPKTGIFYDG